MRFSIVLLLSLLMPVMASADELDSRTSTWFMSLTRIKFTEDVRGFVDIQPRFTLNDISDGKDGGWDTLLLRGALGIQLSPNVGLYQGYAYIPTYDPKQVEHRSFQELLIKQPLTKGSFAHRLRFEQRFLDGDVNETAYRFRYFARLLYPLQFWHPKLSLAINEEVFINLNDADDGPQSGFNQNRLFVGLNYGMKPNLAYEFGYQNQYVNRTSGKGNISNNILFFGVQTNFSWLD
jgi:hypothetical protein